MKKVKSLTMPKKLKGGPFGIFQDPFSRKTPKKLKGDPSGNKFSRKKSRNAEKTERGPLWSSIVCYAGNLFGSVPWDKGYNLASPQNIVELLG